MPRFFGFGIVAMLCNVLWLHFVTLSPPSPLSPSTDTQRQIAHLEEQLSVVMEHLETSSKTKATSITTIFATHESSYSQRKLVSSPKIDVSRDEHTKAEQQYQHHKVELVQREQSDGTSSLNLSLHQQNSSLSACLLIKDDNDLLNEWLAYHMHALNLKYLVVAVDPSSGTSPTPIFNRWRNLTDMQIVEWSDRDFMPATFLERGYHIHPDQLVSDAKKSPWHVGHEDPEQVKRDNLIITNHRFRQVTFLSGCLNHMRQQGKNWVMHIDTDEFVVLNPILRRHVNGTAKDAVTQTLVDYAVQVSAQSPKSVLNALQYIVGHGKMRSKVGYPCISMPRLLFGSNEMEDYHNETTIINTTTTTGSLASSMFNSTLLETLRWRFHTDFDDRDRNAQPKVIVDVSQVPESDRMFSDPFSIHRPSMSLCRSMGKLNFREMGRFPVTVNHYLGSWERYYLSKNDTRRSERAYQFKANVAAGRDDWLESWLDGFVAAHGPDTARQLLHDYATVVAQPRHVV